MVVPTGYPLQSPYSVWTDITGGPVNVLEQQYERTGTRYGFVTEISLTEMWRYVIVTTLISYVTDSVVASCSS